MTRAEWQEREREERRALRSVRRLYRQHQARGLPELRRRLERDAGRAAAHLAFLRRRPEVLPCE